jgi:hypothetical protein
MTRHGKLTQPAERVWVTWPSLTSNVTSWSSGAVPIGFQPNISTNTRFSTITLTCSPHRGATIAVLRKALDVAWAKLSPEQQAQTNRFVMALRILHAADRGERDPVRLCTRALLCVEG